MNVDQIRQHLHDATQLRIPRLDPNLNPGAKIAALEEYMLKVAYARGDLEEAIGWVLEAKHDARRKLDAVQGWEVALPKPADRTQERVLAEKARIDPMSGAVLKDADYYLRRLERQVRRLELDHNAVSRAYTLITGQA